MNDINLNIEEGGTINLALQDSGTIDVSIIETQEINLSIEGVTTYLGLTDTDSSYAGKAGKGPIVNPGEDGMTFGSPQSTWGGIVGTLSNQTDLQAALDAKEEDLTFSTGLNRIGDTITVNGSEILHQELSGSGTNTHADIDTHIANVTTNPHSVDKTDVGLSNVPNVDTTNASNISSGTLASSLLPPIALTSVQLAASEVAQLALTTEEGDVVVRTDEEKSYMRNSGISGTMTDFNELQSPTDLVISVNGETGTVILTTGDISEDVDANYVSDAEKIVLGNTSNTNTGDQVIPNVDDTAYNATSWNANTDASTKNAIRDKIETMDTAIGLNTSKVTNANHTGDVTGNEALTIDKTAITGKSLVTAVGSDHVLISDASDTGNLKKVLVSDFGGGGAPEGTAVLSTGETGATKFLGEDGDNSSSWKIPLLIDRINFGATNLTHLGDGTYTIINFTDAILDIDDYPAGSKAEIEIVWTSDVSSTVNYVQVYDQFGAAVVGSSEIIQEIVSAGIYQIAKIGVPFTLPSGLKSFMLQVKTTTATNMTIAKAQLVITNG